MKIIIAFGIILHFLFLGSVFYIYFQSPILKDLEPQENISHPPAKRLVLFVADGLRAESFFRKDCLRTEYLRSLILKGGMMGISHTRVPTESRPGHVALIAGFYEDPSAVLKGWQENPVEFDSVFNRSDKTYSWGSPDILPMFAKGAVKGRVETFSYDPNEENFSRKVHTSLLDGWVFDRVKLFLQKPENIEMLATNDRVVLFLHLLGMDTAGHVHKPHSALFAENLMFVDHGIKEMVRLIEKATNYDKKTAYVFTSDHGMTDRGSHGSGHHHETETPFIAWGAGVSNWRHLEKTPKQFIEIDKMDVPRWDIKQADAAPLMSSLIGSAVPMNNFGILPKNYLNTSTEYVAKSMMNNALQLLEQYKKWRQISKKKLLQFLLSSKELTYELKLNEMNHYATEALNQSNYEEVIKICDDMIITSIEAIDYYQCYYKDELLIALTLTMLGWIFILLLQVFSDVSKEHDKRSWSLIDMIHKHKCLFACSVILVVGIIVVNLLQNSPKIVILYFIIPIFTWVPVLINLGQLKNIFDNRFKLLIFTCLSIAGVECCVASFFHRQILSVVLMLHSIYLLLEILRRHRGKYLLLILWTLSSICLAVFPILPVVGKDSDNIYLLIPGIVLWMLKPIVSLAQKTWDRKHLSPIFQTIFMFVVGIHLIYVIYRLEQDEGISLVNHGISWFLLVSTFFLSIFSSKLLKQRIDAIVIYLSVPFTLMSLSYEPIFFLSFAVNLCIWIQLESMLYSSSDDLFEKLSFDDKTLSKRMVDANDIRRVFIFMTYLLVSFFGTGNMATVSSFDPNWVRCFVTKFSPFLMSSLIILKLMMPILLMVCILKAIHIITKIETQKLFILILVICDVMCLNFFFLIKNKGSWLDIGISISHFVIMECTILVLILLYGVGSLLTEFKINFRGNSNEREFNVNILPYRNKVNQD